MKAVFISFLIFMTSMLIVLPSFDIGTQYIPANVLKFAPFVLMGFAVFSQWNALWDYKLGLDLKKELFDRTQEETRLKNEGLHKDTLLAEQTKTNMSFQHKFEQLHIEKESVLTETKILRQSLQKAHDSLAETEKKLQLSLEASGRNAVQAGQEVVNLLSLLQEKGRLLDFLMDEVTFYTDAQIGAAGRVVHQGCSKVIREFFNISPLHDDDEGTLIKLAKEDSLEAYRILGKNAEEAPFEAKILHRGWGTDKVNLPRRSSPPAHIDGKVVISPIEVEAHA